MHILRQKLKSIDNNAVVSKYSVIYGTYNDCGNIMYIKNVLGGSNRTAVVEYRMQLDKLGIGSEDIRSTNDRTAAEDYILREFFIMFNSYNSGRCDSNKEYSVKGAFLIYKPDQRVMRRNVVTIDDDYLTVRFEIILSLKDEAYKGGKILAGSQRLFNASDKQVRKKLIDGKTATKVICCDFPEMMRKLEASFNTDEMRRSIFLFRNQQFIREYLRKSGYVSFIADGSILPRRGKSDFKTYGEGIIPFKAPGTLKLSIKLPDSSIIEGMGIKEGVTLIVGGGYHGKSTLLSAIEHGTYNHLSGDGREYVITDESAVNISAEDGRSIKNVDISMFLNNLPTKTNTRYFTTDTASGSTSQAAAVIEALEAGSRLLLIDEDRSANNFMTRDTRMQKLVPNDPITPYLDRVRQIYDSTGASSILVIGGSGDYLDVADTVIMMDSFNACDATARSKSICTRYKSEREYTADAHVNWVHKRFIVQNSLSQHVDGREVLELKSNNTILFGKEPVQLESLLTCPSPGQLCGVLLLLRYINIYLLNDRTCIDDIIRKLYTAIDNNGIGVIAHPTASYLSVWEYVRPVELAGIINRMRMIWVK